MESLEVIFGTVVVVLAGIAVIGALVFAVVWEVCAIRRTLADHRRHAQPPGSYWSDHAALTAPHRRP
jgi:hypothetical protein